MTANATLRSVRNIVRSIDPPEKLNILTFPTHERYEENLCRTGHNFYSLTVLPGKEWDEDYAKVPENYHIIYEIPEHIDFDLILAHSSCGRLQIAHDILSSTMGLQRNACHIPILRHCHVLPDIRFDVAEQIKFYQSVPIDVNSFISNFNMQAWGYNKSPKTHVIEHGIDTDFWKPIGIERENTCLSVVNDWPNRDWCCGFNLWKQTIHGLPFRAVGKSPGLSVPASSIEHLRQLYNGARIFYNTSLHSPVPTVLLEAMACGCAIVSTETCMIPEIITNGKNGFTSNDPQELRSYLELLLNNEDVAIHMGQKARETIEQKFKLDRFVKSWNQLFNFVLEDYRG